VDAIGRTRILNPGMLKDGGWVGITIDDTGVTAGLELATGARAKKEERKHG
jgi:hypothetical protein